MFVRWWNLDSPELFSLKNKSRKETKHKKQIYEGHSISNAILTINFCLNTLLKFDLAFLKHKFNLPSARQFNT